MSIRIGVLGSYSVGKTTLQARLSSALRLEAINEGSRVVAEGWGYTPATIPTNLLWEFQEAILHRQVAQEQRLHHKGFITDTCTLDNTAWMTYIASSVLVVPEPYQERYLDLAATRLGAYDVLLLVPPVIPIEDDGTRHTDPVLREEIHARIIAMLHHFEYKRGIKLEHKVFPLTATTPAGREAEALGVIERVTARGLFPMDRDLYGPLTVTE